MALYVPSTASDYGKFMVKNMPTQDIRIFACDEIARIMWNAAPWRWTLDSIPTVTIVQGQQDYVFSKPSDFLYLAKAYIFDPKQNRDLEIVSSLPTTVGTLGVPTQIAYINDGSDKLRLSPIPDTLIGTRTITGLYKKKYTPITALNIGTAGILEMDDEWSWVYEEGVLWKFYQYADDQRAGSATVNGESVQYSGQLGIFMAGIEEMRKAEKPLLIFPGTPATRG